MEGDPEYQSVHQCGGSIDMSTNIALLATACKPRLQVPSRRYRSAAPELDR